MKEKQELIIFSKCDIIDSEQLEEIQSYFEDKTQKKVSLTISAGAYIRTDELRDLLIEKVPERNSEEQALPQENTEITKIYDLKKQHDPKKCSITQLEN